MNVVIFSVPVLDNSINSAFTTAISASSSNCSSSESFSFNLLIVQFKDVIEDRSDFEMATSVNYGVASSSSSSDSTCDSRMDITRIGGTLQDTSAFQR